MNEQSSTITQQSENLEIKTTALDKILDKALENDVDMNRLEHLIALREKEIDRQYYEKFVSDLSAMQSECKEIIKTATNNFTNSKICYS
ncbi:hypothetical protein [Bartonella ancashensis]|uniref:hypothetical protein n=1 Tax=Bartonella ancashensis TaxID=1318743 RepID=UPI003D9C1D0B